MAYASFDDVIARYRPMSTIVGSDTQMVRTLDVTSIFVYGAEGIMDAYLARKYVTPVPAGPLITQIASDLSIFNILVEHQPQVPDYMKDRYDRAIKLLEQIAAGELVLTSATVLTTGDQEAWSSTQNYHTIFDPTLTPDEQVVDVDRRTAAQDERSSDYDDDQS